MIEINDIELGGREANATLAFLTDIEPMRMTYTMRNRSVSPYPIFAPGYEWYKSSTDRSTYTKIEITNSYTPTGNENETWNADVDNSGSIKCYRIGTTLIIAGNGSGKIAANENSMRWATKDAVNAFSKVTTFTGLNLLDVSNVKDFSGMLACFASLTSLDLSSWDVSNGEAFAQMFYGCVKLVSIQCGNWNMSKATNLFAMFYNCTALTSLDLLQWNVSNVTRMDALFHLCSSLTALDLSTWNTSQVTTMSKIFAKCSKLTSINVSTWNTSNVQDMTYAFSECLVLPTIDISNWTVDNVTALGAMFQYCQKLTTLIRQPWNTAKATDISYAFFYCAELEHLDVSDWNVEKAESLQQIFCYCRKLKTLNVSTWKPKSATTFRHAFYQCYALENIDISAWEANSLTDLYCCFYDCRALSGKILDVAGWDVSHVTTMYFCFTNSHAIIKGYENWDVSKCVSLCGLFATCQNEYFDVSKWNVSACRDYALTFTFCEKAKEIKGLNKWNTANGKGFLSMFKGCTSLRSLDLSTFNTRNASNSWKGEYYYGSLDEIFADLFCLQKITLSNDFSFKGDGTCPTAVIPTPSSEYIPSTEGFWYDDFGNKYAPGEVPQKTAGTYYASLELMNRFYGIDRLTLLELAKSVKAITGLYGNITFADMKNALDNFDGLQAGKDVLWNEFWDNFQMNGTRTNYQYGFKGPGWNDTTFKPKYDISPKTTGEIYYMFDSAKITDLVKILNEQNVKINISSSPYFTSIMSGSTITTFPEFKPGTGVGTVNAFNNATKLRSIEKIVAAKAHKYYVSLPSNTCFYNCTALEHAPFEGTIGKNAALDLHWSTLLDRETLLSVIACLDDCTAETTAPVCTLGPENLAKLTDAELAVAVEKGWTLA